MNGWIQSFDKSGPDQFTRWVPATLEQSIAQNIRAILLTRKGERRQYPDFGSLIHEFFFRILDSTLITEMQAHIKEAIEQSERRIRVQEVKVFSSADENSAVQIAVSYLILDTAQMNRIKVVAKP